MVKMVKMAKKVKPMHTTGTAYTQTGDGEGPSLPSTDVSDEIGARAGCQIRASSPASTGGISRREYGSAVGAVPRKSCGRRVGEMRVLPIG